MKVKDMIFIVVPVLAIAIGIGSLLLKGKKMEENVIFGIAETRHIDVASKIPGRIGLLSVKEGDYLSRGQIVAVLESKEMNAKVEQARGAMNAAKAKMMMAKNGLRPKELEAALKQYLQAKAQAELLEKTYNRVMKLFKDSTISSQEKDQAEAQYISAREQMEAAKARYEMATEGARSEEREAAQSLFYQAENVFSEANAYAEELEIKSPVNGEVEKIISDPGELVASGYPVITIIDTSEIWIIVQIKENMMSKFTKGAEFKGKIPALANQEYSFKVNYISPMADFATWRPTNQKGEFDIRTFEVHLRPVSKIKDFRAGMTVCLALQ